MYYQKINICAQNPKRKIYMCDIIALFVYTLYVMLIKNDLLTLEKR
jgi:hypothetical protein